jgi:hypothetical protein
LIGKANFFKQNSNNEEKLILNDTFPLKKDDMSMKMGKENVRG